MLELRPYQQVGRDFLTQRTRACLWDEMGLGKTYQALCAAKEVGLPVVVVGPPKLKTDWMSSAAVVGVKIQYLSFTRVPDDLPEPSTVIFEEAHWIQGGADTKRGASALDLAFHPNTAYLWMLTGTPMLNGRPINLLPVCQILKIVPNVIDRAGYLARYCGPRQYNIGAKIITRYVGATRVDELANLLQPYVLKRSKDAVDLPAKLYCDRSVPIENRKAMQIAIDAAFLRMSILCEIRGYENIFDDLMKLRIVSVIKEASEIDKINYVLELAEGFASDDQSLYFCTYQRTAKELSAALKCPALTGKSTQKQRDDAIADFQTGRVKNLVLTIKACGVGINLTSAKNVVFVGRDWTPECNLQAEDRVHRIGQSKTVTIFRLSNEMDDHLLRLLGEKGVSGAQFDALLAKAFKRTKQYA